MSKYLSYTTFKAKIKKSNSCHPFQQTNPTSLISPHLPTHLLLVFFYNFPFTFSSFSLFFTYIHQTTPHTHCYPLHTPPLH
eukprot:UN04165